MRRQPSTTALVPPEHVCGTCHDPPVARDRRTPAARWATMRLRGPGLLPSSLTTVPGRLWRGEGRTSSATTRQNLRRLRRHRQRRPHARGRAADRGAGRRAARLRTRARPNGNESACGFISPAAAGGVQGVGRGGPGRLLAYEMDGDIVQVAAARPDQRRKPSKPPGAGNLAWSFGGRRCHIRSLADHGRPSPWSGLRSERRRG